MNEELEKLLRENLEISKENLRILKKINRARIFDKIYGFLKLAFFLLITVGSYYYIEPYIRDLMAVFNQVSAGLGEAQKTSQMLSPTNLPPETLEKLKAFFGQ